MDQWINSKTFQQVSAVHQEILKQLTNNTAWRKNIETEISNGKIRAFQTFFDSPSECNIRNVEIQVLREYDLAQMYPELVDKVQSLKAPQLVYIFTCCDGVAPGQALIAHTIV